VDLLVEHKDRRLCTSFAFAALCCSRAAPRYRPCDRFAPWGLPRRKEGWVKPIASMPQISRVSEGWAYDACPRLRGQVRGRWRVKFLQAYALSAK